MAMSSMQQASQYGAIVAFCTQLFQLETPEALMQSIAAFFDRQYGLKTAIMLTTGNKRYYHFYGQESCSSLVKKVLQVVHQKGRIYQYQDNRLVFNDTGVSIIVLNAPGNADELGRIKDIGSTVIAMFGEKWKECRDALALNGVARRMDKMTSDIGAFATMMQERQNASILHFEKQIQES